MLTNRRTFIKTAAVGAASLAACTNDAGNSAPTDPTTTAGTTPATTTPPTVAPSTVATTTAAPTPSTTIAPLARNDKWWLDRNFGPVVGDLAATDLRVVGELPAGLSGTWVRNGPNPPGDSSHWFLGNGMLHGLRIRDGRAEWYRRSEVRTPYFDDPQTTAVVGGPVSYSSVSSVSHGGRLLSLGELGFPYEVDIDDLSTVGAYDFDGALTTSMTAHPKIDPDTGEMLFFGYNFLEPYLTYLVADPTGTVQGQIPISLPAPSMVHDFGFTEQSVLFLDLAVLFDPADPALPYRFDRSHQCRLGVLDRAATTDTTRWFDIESCFVFHTINAHQDGDIITYDVIRYDELWVDSSTESFPAGYPYRYTVDLAAGTVTEGRLDDRPSEFPMIDHRFAGRANTLSWAASVGTSVSEPERTTLLQYGADGSSASAASFTLAAADVGGEPLFVADSARAAEGGGWLLMVVFRGETNTSDVIVFDASDVGSGPVATIELPDRVPFGFHASWTPLT